MALALCRAAGGVPEGASLVQAGLPLPPFALLRTQTSLKYPVEQLFPPNTIMDPVVGSYTAAGYTRGAGGVPEGVKAIQVALPFPFAPSRIHASLAQGEDTPRAPPNIVMRLLLGS